MVRLNQCLVVVALVLLTSAVAYEDLFLKLYESQHRVKLLHEQLERECPNKFQDRDFKYEGKRSIFGSESLRVRIDVENKLGDHLVDLLVECRRNSSHGTTTSRPYYNYTHTTRYRPVYNYTTTYHWLRYNTTYNSTGRWLSYNGSYVTTRSWPYYNYTTRYQPTYNRTTTYHWPSYNSTGRWPRYNGSYVTTTYRPYYNYTHTTRQPLANYTTTYHWPRYSTTNNSTGRWPMYNTTYTTRYWYHHNTTTSSPSTDGNFPFLPLQCTSPKTVSLTESWRNNYGRRGYHKDAGIYDEGRTWFRFTGKAGNQLKNTCPNQYSCGSSAAYWSDDRMPSSVGETLHFYMYESLYSGDHQSFCKERKFRSKATLCSNDGDYVYLLEERMSDGYDTLCGKHQL